MRMQGGVVYANMLVPVSHLRGADGEEGRTTICQRTDGDYTEELHSHSDRLDVHAIPTLASVRKSATD